MSPGAGASLPDERRRGSTDSHMSRAAAIAHAFSSEDVGSGSQSEGVTSGGGSEGVHGAGKRLAHAAHAIFGDKLHSDRDRSSARTAPPAHAHLSRLHNPHPHAHAHRDKPESAPGAALPGAPASASISAMAANSASKAHASPTKGSARTYDSKLVSREMHRLGNLAHLPVALAPSISAGTTSSTLALPPSNLSAPSVSANGPDNPWGTLHVLVLPLFNGEPLRIPIEDLNTLVKRHISSIVSNSPSKAIANLETEASELIGSGMDTLNGKLAGIEDDKLVGRVVELWGFFWDQVLPYVEGVLLPLQTDPILSSLYRTPKTHRGSSPTRQPLPALGPSSNQIDVRTVALRSFRDKIILPIFPRLNARLAAQKQDNPSDSHIYPRLQQMLLVLVSQGRRQPQLVSLTEPALEPTPGEAAVTHLLRLVRSTTTPAPDAPSALHSRRTPSFLSGNVPRDRRGRIAQRPGPLRVNLDCADCDEDDGGETPKLGFHGVGRGRGGRGSWEREREFLEALRSPEAPPSANDHRESVGGWGLGTWHEEAKAKDEDDEDEGVTLEQVQADVERMVGMKAPDTPSHPETRRRVT